MSKRFGTLSLACILSLSAYGPSLAQTSGSFWPFSRSYDGSFADLCGRTSITRSELRRLRNSTNFPQILEFTLENCPAFGNLLADAAVGSVGTRLGRPGEREDGTSFSRRRDDDGSTPGTEVPGGETPGGEGPGGEGPGGEEPGGEEPGGEEPGGEEPGGEEPGGEEHGAEEPDDEEHGHHGRGKHRGHKGEKGHKGKKDRDWGY